MRRYLRTAPSALRHGTRSASSLASGLSSAHVSRSVRVSESGSTLCQAAPSRPQMSMAEAMGVPMTSPILIPSVINAQVAGLSMGTFANHQDRVTAASAAAAHAASMDAVTASTCGIGGLPLAAQLVSGPPSLASGLDRYAASARSAAREEPPVLRSVAPEVASAAVSDVTEAPLSAASVFAAAANSAVVGLADLEHVTPSSPAATAAEAAATVPSPAPSAAAAAASPPPPAAALAPSPAGIPGEDMDGETLSALYEKQFDLEMGQLDRQVSEYRAQVQGLMQLGQGASLSLPKRLMVQWFGPLCEAIDAEQAAIWANDHSEPVRASYGPILLLLPPDKLAVIVMHEALNLLLHAGGTAKVTAVAMRVGEAVQAELSMARLRHKDRRQWSRLAVEFGARPAPSSGPGGKDAGDGAHGGGNDARRALRKRSRELLAEAGEWQPGSIARVGAALLDLLTRACVVRMSPDGRLLEEVDAQGEGGGAADGGAEGAKAASAAGAAGVAAGGGAAAASSTSVAASAAAIMQHYNKAVHPRSKEGRAASAAHAAAVAAAAAGGAGAPAAAPAAGSAAPAAAASVTSATAAASPAGSASAGSGGAGSGGGGVVLPAFSHSYQILDSSNAGAFNNSPVLRPDLGLNLADKAAQSKALHAQQAQQRAASSSASGSLAASAVGQRSGSGASGSGASGSGHGYGHGLMKTVGVLTLHPRLQELLLDSAARFVQPVQLPMLVPPRPWTGPREGGFLRASAALLRTLPGHRIQQGLARKARMDEVYAALNVLGNTPWRLNAFVHDTVSKVWADGGGIAAIPSRKDVTLPEPPTPEELAALPSDAERAAALRRHKRALNGSMRANADLHSLRCDMALKLDVARQFEASVMFFPHNVDFRGRAYPIPPHLNHMGADVTRALLTFARAKPLGQRGLRWLKVHVSNLMGRDKVSMDDRAAFTEAHMAEVMDSAARPLTGNGWWLASGDGPWQALAAMKELAAAYSYGGKPEDYTCALPIHQDGSCNGLQHYAALGRDEHGGRAVNLLPVAGDDKPQDVYSQVLRLVLKRLDADAAGESLSPELKAFLASADGRRKLAAAAERRARLGGSSAAGAGAPGSDAGTPAGASPAPGSGSGVIPPLDPANLVADAFCVHSIAVVASAAATCRNGDVQKLLKQRLHMLAAQTLRGMVDRKVVKQTVMTSVYGVTLIGAKDQVLARLKEKFDIGIGGATSAAVDTATAAAAAAAAAADLIARLEGRSTGPAASAASASASASAASSGPAGAASSASSLSVKDAPWTACPTAPPPSRMVSDEQQPALSQLALYLAHTTLGSLGDLFHSADAIKVWLGDVASIVAAAEQPMSWVTPLGLPVVQPYRREKAMLVRTLLQDLVVVDHSEQLPVSSQRQRSAFPPNFVHSLDSTHMMMTALDCSRNLGLTFAAVHDSYWTHAGDVDAMSESLRRQFVRLYSLPLLEDFRASLVARFPALAFPELPSRGALDLREVMRSKYFFA